MYYPLNLVLAGQKPAPLFGELLKGKPHIFDFSSANATVSTYPTRDFDTFQRQIFAELEKAGAQWGIGKYLEERKRLLSDFPQMIEQKRYYHAGLDVVVAAASTLFAPLAGTVYRVGIDEGAGNYGGYVVLEHHLEGVTFFSLYGHLSSHHRVEVGRRIEPGAPVGLIGTDRDSGGWFTHTHLQVLTARAVDDGRLLHGYVTLDDLGHIEEIFPSPYFLFCP